MAKAKTSDKGKIKGAHPTAPGGMSEAQLRKELTTKHNYLDAEVDEGAMSWTELIDAVIEGRKAREREDKAGPPLLVRDPDTNDYAFNGHAGTGPSSAHRWLYCTKSLGASRRFLETLTPNQQAEFAKSSTAARQGTTAHSAGEAELSAILGHTTVAERDATLLELAVIPEDGESYDDEMAEHVSLYVDLISEFIEERGAENVLLEQKLEAAVWLTGDHEGNYYLVRGSADAVINPTKAHKNLVIVDYKHGEADVDVEENDQVRTYALGALGDLTDDDGNLTVDLERITYYIVQPRNGGVKMWEESLDALLDWRDETLAPALTAALYDDESATAEFVPSDKSCQWCPARGACPALSLQRMEAATELFDVITETEFEEGPGAFPETGLMEDAALGRLLEQVNGLMSIQEDLKAEVQRRLHRGAEIPGFKMVSYTPPRKWKEGAKEDLRERFPELFAEKIITPKQALALLQASKEEAVEDVTGYIETPDPRPVAAPEMDRRKKWTGEAPESMFTELEAD